MALAAALAFGLRLGPASVAAEEPPGPHAPRLAWETAGFVAPESVVFDGRRQQFYVSNMGTWGEGSKVGDGFLSRLDPQGRMLERRWVTGLDNPKGLALARGRLYVGDDHDLVEVDPDRAAVTARHRPADGRPGGFNDCTADPAGDVFVFSRRLSRVFRLREGRLEPWAAVDVETTGGPNGLLAERGRLLLGGWATNREGAPKQPGRIATLAYATGALGFLGDRTIDTPDGIEADGRGGYTVTDWGTGDVWHISAGGAWTRILMLPRGAADHHYLVDQRLLVIPLILDHVVRAYRWAPDAAH